MEIIILSLKKMTDNINLDEGFISKTTASVKEILSREKFLTIAVGTFTGLSIIHFFIQSKLFGMLDKFEKGDASIQMSLGSFVEFYTLVSGLVSLVFIVGAVAVCMWFYRAHENLNILNKRLEYTPGWAAGWFFVPFANLIMPFKVMREIHNGTTIAYSDKNIQLKGMPAHYAVAVWWLGYILSGIVSSIGNGLIKEDRVGFGGNDYHTAILLDGIGSVLLVLSFVYLYKLVKEISSKQHRLKTGEKEFVPMNERGERLSS
jgi:hypothetical protein